MLLIRDELNTFHSFRCLQADKSFSPEFIVFGKILSLFKRPALYGFLLFHLSCNKSLVKSKTVSIFVISGERGDDLRIRKDLLGIADRGLRFTFFFEIFFFFFKVVSIENEINLSLF